MRILFLDDAEERHHTFRRHTIGHVVDFAHGAKEAIEMLKGERYDLASLDHDLCEEAAAGLPSSEPTGMLVAEYIAAMPSERRPSVVSVHSLNPSAAPRMVATLMAACITLRAPFSQVSIEYVLRFVAP